MKRLTLQTQNHWLYVKDGGSVDLLHIGGAASRWYVSAFVSLLGFGVGLTLWLEQPLPPAWEPIETDGWAGEPQGMEHAP
jgi:hypothetical protein